MNALVICGIDPGKGGAVAFLDGDGAILEVHDMPDATGAALGARLRDLFIEMRPTFAYVELVGYMPGQRGGWTFAEGYGGVLATLGAWDVPSTTVPPSKWKADAGLTKRKGETKAQSKTRSRQRATELWPAYADLFARVKDDGRAEACLVARHGWLALGKARAAA